MRVVGDLGFSHKPWAWLAQLGHGVATRVPPRACCFLGMRWLLFLEIIWGTIMVGVYFKILAWLGVA